MEAICDLSGDCHIYRAPYKNRRPPAKHPELQSLGIPTMDVKTKWGSLTRAIYFHNNPSVDREYSIVNKCNDLRCLTLGHILPAVRNPPRSKAR